jgi:tripartite-type tricarboxylate transporter receptor subunit TctC
METTMKAISLAVAGLLLAAGSPAHAQSVAEFYKGKTIRMVVGIDVGSGYDVNARLLAKHIVNHIPGNPSIVVQNQPGAGSANMTAQVYANGPFDGTVIGAAFAGLPTYPLFTPAAATRFDLTKLNWLGNTNRETHVTYVWHTSPVQSFADLQTKELIMGAQAPGSSQVDFPLVANALFKLKHKVITGYGSTAKINLAMESGEVYGAIAALTSVRTLSSQWLAEKKIKIITQWALRANPDLPGVPNAFDLAKTDSDRAAMQLVMARLDVGRPFFLPPNVPADRVAALRAAFDATMKDKAYLAEAAKLKIDVDPMTGADLTAFVAQVLKTPPETVARVRKALETK